MKDLPLILIIATFCILHLVVLGNTCHTILRLFRDWLYIQRVAFRHQPFAPQKPRTTTYVYNLNKPITGEVAKFVRELKSR